MTPADSGACFVIDKKTYITHFFILAARDQHRRQDLPNASVDSAANLKTVTEAIAHLHHRQRYRSQQLSLLSVLLQHDAENLPAFFSELENKLPSTVNVISFTADDTTVTMNMNVESKEAAAMVVEQLRTFDSLMSVNARAITEEINELGGSVVNMTAVCTYAPYTREDPDAAGEEAVQENEGQEAAE